MSGFGTDVLAVTCILASGAASTAATAAFMERGERNEADAYCAVERAETPRVIVTTADRKGTVVISRSRIEDGRTTSCASEALEFRVSPAVRVQPSDVLQLRYQLDVARQRQTEQVYRFQLEEMRERLARARAEIEGSSTVDREELEEALQRQVRLMERTIEQASRDLARATERAARVREGNRD